MMNDSQKALLSRLMFVIDKGFASFNVQQQSEIAEALLTKIKRKIETPHRLQQFRSALNCELAENDATQARRDKLRKAAEEQAAKVKAEEQAAKVKAEEQAAEVKTEEHVEPTADSQDLITS